MIQRDDIHHPSANRDLSDTGEGDDIPRRLRLSSREIGVAMALTLAAMIQLFWSLNKPDDKLSSALPGPAAITGQAR
ncbi:MAG: hypothetical protein ABL901_19810 [Hyphomicrobiaceae bacterium]